VSVEVTLATNFDQAVRKQFAAIEASTRKAQSIALEKTIAFGARTTAKSGQRSLDDPIKAVFDGKKSRNRLGWIWFEWDERADIKRKNGKGSAFLQIQGQGPAQARKEQQEAIHRQVFGTTETEGTTPAVPFIIRPSERLRREGGIRGVPLKIDKFGNLRNYRKNLTKMLAQKDKFFQVKIGERGRGNNENGRNLPPGLYFRKLGVRRYKRNRHTKRRGGSYGGGAKKKFTRNIITILRYFRIQKYKARWKFDKEVVTAMKRRYEREFLVQLTRQLRKQKGGNRFNQDKVGAFF